MSVDLNTITFTPAEEDTLVEKFVETIGGKIIASVSGYNYSNHDPNKEGIYHSWPLGNGKGNAVFLIRKGVRMGKDIPQDIIVSERIEFVKFKD